MVACSIFPSLVRLWVELPVRDEFRILKSGSRALEKAGL